MPKVEKGIPIPTIGGSGEFPFAEMEIGDSFRVEVDQAKRVRSYVSEPSRVGKYSVVKYDGAYRCWRVA